MPHHQSQRRRRRHSAVCNRHPTSKPTTGFCASCLRERLSTIEAALSSDQPPELRRARSHSVRDTSAADFHQPRRRSCDVSNDATLHHRFADDDEEEEEEDEERIRSSIRIPMVPDLKEEEEEEEGEEKKTMKELIDLESRTTHKTNNDKESSFTSVFSRTLKRLSLRHHPKSSNAQNGDVYSKTGRRSCDVDPRLSLDAVSFEEPRASWDGCLIGKMYHPKLIPLSSLTEDAKPSPEKEEEKKPGGTAQTRDYYLDSRRRRSFDRSSSRHGLVDVVEEVKESSVGLFHGAKLLVTERELRDSNWYSIKNYKPESLEFASKGVCVAAGAEVKQEGFGLKKSGKKWGKGWNLWGLIQRKAADTSKKEDQSLKLGGNGMEGCSLADSLLKLRRVAAKGGKSNGGGDVSEKLLRSYSVSARKSCDDDGIFHGASLVNNGFQGGRSSCDGLFHGSITTTGGGAETGRRSLCDDKHSHLLQRDAKLGASYSPDNLRNGMVRFYLTPLKSHVTSGDSGKTRLMN